MEFADEFDALMRDEHVERLAYQDALIKRVTKAGGPARTRSGRASRALDAKARAHPAVQFLMTIPGQVRYEPHCGT